MNTKNSVQSLMAQMLKPLAKVPYTSKWLILLIDIGISIFAFTLSYLICYELLEVPVITDAFLLKLLLDTVVTLFFFFLFKVYRGIIRYSTFMDALLIFVTIAASTLTMMAINYVLSLFDKSIFLNIGFFIKAMVMFSFMLLLRMAVKIVYDNVRDLKTKEGVEAEESTSEQKSLFIVGISAVTVSLARLIIDSDSKYHLLGFISVNSNGDNKKVMGIPVYDNKEQFRQMIQDGTIESVLIDTEQLDPKTKQEIADICLTNRVEMLSPPPVSQWCRKIEMQHIQIEDLLGRAQIEIDTYSIQRNLNDRCVLITGAAGSIGSEIVRQVCRFNPRLLLLCDIAETPLYQIQLELKECFPNVNFKIVVADVKDLSCMNKIFNTYRPEYIYHAAAYKHVPLMEAHPSEAILTNVMGTKNMADLAVKYNADAFVMISTDKAVNPTNIMGTSKRIAEIYVQSLSNKIKSSESKTVRFITTRFGNVLGSNGSVITLFKDQLAKGGPLTVTHPDIIRYFMTIPEACRLVLEAGNMGKGGEIFVFDMGKPVRIVDMAERMIQLAGYVPYQDIDIKFVGLRPGEKLYEELLTSDELTKPTHNKKIMIANVRTYDFEKAKSSVDFIISKASIFNNEEVVALMKLLVPEFLDAKDVNLSAEMSHN